ncbi:hypothetical protein M2351_000970 [Azospirillum canadense]|nr:hypothetical protein [Azospirillum canadense]
MTFCVDSSDVGAPLGAVVALHTALHSAKCASGSAVR